MRRRHLEKYKRFQKECEMEKLLPTPQTPPESIRNPSSPDDGTRRPRTPRNMFHGVKREEFLYVTPSYEVEIIKVKESSDELADKAVRTQRKT